MGIEKIFQILNIFVYTAKTDKYIIYMHRSGIKEKYIKYRDSSTHI